MLDLRTIRKVFFLLPLQAVVSEEWRADIPTEVTAQRGLCARIPCHYRYPSSLENERRTGVWFNNVEWKANSIVFHSRDHAYESSKFQHRTQLTGDLYDSDCSLVINNIEEEDRGPYFFRIEFTNDHNFDYPVIQLHVSDFTDKSSIFATEMVAGKPVKITCTFKSTCEKMTPTLTWDTPTDVSASSSSRMTQWGDTLTYTSVLTMNPAPKHHGQSLTCRVSYPSVSSEQTLTLTVRYKPKDVKILSSDSVVKGSQVTLRCESVGNPPADTYQWKKVCSGMEMRLEGFRHELQIRISAEDESCAYYCRAGNVIGDQDSEPKRFNVQCKYSHFDKTFTFI
ncbi:sialic acid-binding Ig-like lectin 7 [Mobula hypostoma]|uniref:sialic acid-binding Ig-like lectin 7 n=1 Tax=Mobula hypostoma TaxID=723540 RepID=UPI002FC3E0C2